MHEPETRSRRHRRLLRAQPAARPDGLLATGLTTSMVVEVDGANEEDEDRRRAEGRAALSRTVAAVVDACSRPKPVHGGASGGAIPSCFWAQPGEDDKDSDDDDAPSTPSTPEFNDEEAPSTSDVPSTPSTPEFVKVAAEAGFVAHQLIRAERALNEGTKASPGGLRLARSIVQRLVQQRTSGKPW